MARGLLFDLFNTLVHGQDGGRAEVTRAMGADLGVDPAAFAFEFAATWHERMTGSLGDFAAQCTAIAGRLGGSPDESQIAVATDRRLQFNRRTLEIAPATLATIDDLRDRGWRIGIVSNCTIDSGLVLAETSLPTHVDAVVLSYAARLAKPDPSIYRLAADRLGVAPAGCVYVGDGADNELAGAAALDMRVIQTVQHGVTDPTWTGERISDVAELAAVLAGEAPAG